VQKNPLIVASEMIEQYGDKAEIFAGERMDMALQAGDSQAFEEWTLIGKGIAFLTRQSQPPVPVKPRASDTSAPEYLTHEIAIAPIRRVQI
jgi:hypothetical protein